MSTAPTEVAALPTRTVAWAVGLCAAGLVFDGYDLVVYGALVPLFLRSPGEIGALDADTAGILGSLALVGVLIGALTAGAFADRWGRRPVLLAGYAWFSIGMAATALTSSVAAFGTWRLLTGLGIGAVVATTGALVAEVAPAGRRKLCTTAAYCGIPVGSVIGTLAALTSLDQIGWRGLFWIGALPLLTLLPLAVARLPESPAWLASRAAGDRDPRGERTGFAALFGRESAASALVLGLASAIGLLLIFALGTWLPELLGRSGFDDDAALVSLLVLNVGAIVGAVSAAPLAERFGPRRIVAVSFALGAIALAVVATQPGGSILLSVVAVVGLGTTGTQILLIGLAAATFTDRNRGAGVAWCTGFGRVGGICGPLVVGFFVARGSDTPVLFVVLATLAAIGAALTLAVRPASAPSRPADRTRSPATPMQR